MATLLLDVAVRAALIAAGTASILWALRIRTAAVRHAAWTTVVIGMLLLPIWFLAGPKVPLAVLPTNATSLDSGSGANPDGKNAMPQVSGTEPGPAPIAEPAATASESARGMVVLIGVYLLGAVTLLIRLAIGTVQAHRLRRGAVMRAGRPTSARCATPITVGWLSPVLILPEGWERWSASHLDAVVTHEREHARRHDPLVQWLALLNRAIFWFHPLAWWLDRRLSTLAEEACDAAVIRAGHSPQDYSNYLIDMARALRRQGRRLNVVGLAMPGGNLPARMRHIFEEFPMTPLSRTRVVCTLAFCATASIVCAAGVLTPRPPAVAASPATAGAPVRLDAVSLEPGPTLPPRQSPGSSQGVPPGALQLSPGQESVTPSEPVNRPRPGTNAQLPDRLEPPRRESPERVPGEPARVNTADFSGHWSLVSATTTGPGRGGSGGDGGERNVMSVWASGAPVNCGPECVMVQNAKTLTIRRSVNPEGTWVPDDGEVVLNLDGSDSTVNHPSGTHYVVHANWEGDKLVVTYHYAYFTVTQVLSVEAGKLKVITDFGVGYSPVTLTYAKG